MSTIRGFCFFFLLTLSAGSSRAAEPFRLVTYNVENYCLEAQSGREPKTEAARSKVAEILGEVRPDVLALEEICSEEALKSLQKDLLAQKVDLPHRLLLVGPDPYVHVAVLSRFSFARTNLQTNLTYLLNGKRRSVSRGFLEVEIKATDAYSFTLLVTHLKSKRYTVDTDEAVVRAEEAKMLRERINAVLNEQPNVNLAVVGDFNDTKDSPAVRTLVGRGNTALVDTRPGEEPLDAKGKIPRQRRTNQRTVTWTHHFAKEDSYSRLDYILLSKGMAREWIEAESYVPSLPDWGLASDHRPVVVTLRTEEK